MSRQQIPQAFIDDLIARADIVEIVDSRVPLKSTGHNFKGLCPFHQEKSPSFSVSATKQFYYCFGCHASGNAIGFLMAYDRLSFIEAVEYLAHEQGVALPKEYIADPIAKSSIDYHEQLKQVMRFYRMQLKNHPDSARVIDYLKRRGLSGDICQRFGIGYAPEGWDTLVQHLGSSHTQALLDTGMLLEKNHKYYDRFRDRIMFPIRDKRGRVLGFGGRILDKGEPKYLNSPETAIFHKGSELYGLYEAMQVQRQFKNIIVVEGYMDVVALSQYGITSVVATMGTALTIKQMSRLFRLSPEVILCFDGDEAGKRAAWRALETSLSLLTDERSLKFIFLQEGDDPDTCVRKIGVDGFNRLIETAQPFSEIFIKHLLAQVDTSHVSGQARLMSLAAPLLAQLPQGVLCDMLVEQLVAYTRLDRHRLMQAIFPVAGKEKLPLVGTTRSGRGISAVDKALCLLLQCPYLAANVENIEELGGLPLDRIQLLIELVQLLRAEPQYSVGTILAHWPDEKVQSELAALASKPLLLTDEAGIGQEFFDIIEKLRKEVAKAELGDLLLKIRQNDLSVLSPDDRLKVVELLGKDEEI